MMDGWMGMCVHVCACLFLAAPDLSEHSQGLEVAGVSFWHAAAGQGGRDVAACRLQGCTPAPLLRGFACF